MKKYGVYNEIDLVAIIKANNYEEAVEKARRNGFDKTYSVEEFYLQ